MTELSEEIKKQRADIDRWRSLPIVQQPDWPDAQALRRVYRDLSVLPPLVFAGEIDRLKRELGKVARGQAFLLQGGDCAESFESVTANNISRRIRTLLQMAVVLTYGASLPVVKMGRMAGQFAKPRSSDWEEVDGQSLPVYRGDIVNGYLPNLEQRTPDPNRMVLGYHASCSTLNLVRAFTRGGFADLREVHRWNKGFAANHAHHRYEQLAMEIDRAIRFMDACGVNYASLSQTELFVGHEGLLLEYESALTRIDSRTDLPYATSGHFLWIGERTRQLEAAHVDFFSRILNPVGVKLGPSTSVEQMLALANRLNPDRIPGRLTFIIRLGASRVADKLPELLLAAKANDLQVVWVCDPMHGNTITSASGYKTRRFEDVLAEVRGFFAAHRQCGTFPGGLHVELTGDDVTECLGGAEAIDEADLAKRYRSLCDPRLNHRQSLELAFLVSEELKRL